MERTERTFYRRDDIMLIFYVWTESFTSRCAI